MPINEKIMAKFGAKAAEYMANPHSKDDHSTVAAFEASNARNAEAIKAVKGRGVKAGISSEAGKMVPAPKGYDPLADKVCQGPGLVKNGFGQARICGRQATAFLDVAHFEPDVPRSPSNELTEAALAFMAYGGASHPVPAATGPRKGKMLPPNGAIGPNSRPVCLFHSQALYRDALHPEDNGGIVPEAPRATGGDPVFGLDKLTPGRPFRCVSSDANYCWVSDGLTTVMCHRADYVRLLAEFGLLPDDSSQPLP
jgi:hypothetical protein